jgi:hypothetical protein
MSDTAVAVSIARLEGEIQRARQHSEGGERQTRERGAFVDRRLELIEKAQDDDRKESATFREEMRLAQSRADGKAEALSVKVGAGTDALGALNATIAGQTSWAEVVKTNPAATFGAFLAVLVFLSFAGGFIDNFNADALGSKFGVNNAEAAKPVPRSARRGIDDRIESDGTDIEMGRPVPTE